MVIRISGKVQGVFYRQSTKQQALELGLTGTVQNLPDGSVQVCCTGTRGQLDELIAWCRKGPANASVTAIECQAADLQAFNSFRIIH